MQRMLLAVLVASLGAVGSAQAQRPQTIHPSSRWVINGHSVAAFGTSIQPTGGGQEFKTSTGLGGGVRVGYMITPRLTTYAGWELAKQPVDVENATGHFGLTHLEAGARLGFPVRGSRMLPYLGAWVARRSLSATVDNLLTGGQSDLSFSGFAVGLSGGLQYALSPKLALDGGLSVGTGSLGNMKLDGQQQVVPPMGRSMTMRVQFGADWHP